MTVNRDLRDAAIRHAALLGSFSRRELLLLSRWLDGEVLPPLEREADAVARASERMVRLPPSRRRAVLEARLGDVEDQARSIGVQLFARLRDRLAEVSVSEAEWQLRTLRRIVPTELAIDFAPASHTLLRSTITARPMQGRFLREWAADVGVNSARRVSAAIRLGVANGASVQQITASVRGTAANGFADGVINATRNEAATVTRTAINHVVTHAHQTTIAANADIIDSVQWVSTLDARTSQICWGLDGLVWPIDRGPRPPAHPSCRSAIVPILKAIEDIPGIDLSRLPAATRASMRGEVPAAQSFAGWLRRQPAAFQDELMGAGKAALFRRGTVPLRRFVDIGKMRPRTLRELEAIEARINASTR